MECRPPVRSLTSVTDFILARSSFSDDEMASDLSGTLHSLHVRTPWGTFEKHGSRTPSFSGLICSGIGRWHWNFLSSSGDSDVQSAWHQSKELVTGGPLTGMEFNSGQLDSKIPLERSFSWYGPCNSCSKWRPHLLVNPLNQKHWGGPSNLV